MWDRSEVEHRFSVWSYLHRIFDIGVAYCCSERYDLISWLIKAQLLYPDQWSWQEYFGFSLPISPFIYPSVCRPNCVPSVSFTIITQSTSYLRILSIKFRRGVACHVVKQFLRFQFLYMRIYLYASEFTVLISVFVWKWPLGRMCVPHRICYSTKLNMHIMTAKIIWALVTLLRQILMLELPNLIM